MTHPLHPPGSGRDKKIELQTMVRKDFTSVTAFTGNHRKPSFEALVWLLPVLKLVLGHVTALQIPFLVPP